MTQKYAWGPFAQQADPIVSGRLSTEILARFPDMAGLGFDLRRDGAMAELLASGFLDLPFVAYNVRSYGAIGDGVADDTLAFNDAITTCNADGGGIVYVPPGTYRIGASGILMKSNVQLFGDGRASVIKMLNGVNAAYLLDFKTNSPTDAGVYHVVLDGNRANQSAGTALVVVGLTAARVTIDTCILRDSYAHAIFGDFSVDTGDVYVHHNIFEGQIGATAGVDMGIKLTYPSLVEARHEVVGNRMGKTAGSGVRLVFVHGGLVALNHIKGDGTGTLDSAINVDRCKGIRVVGNYCSYRGYFGIFVHNTNSASDPNDYNVVADNVCEHNAEAGIAVTGKSRWTVVQGNACKNNALAPATHECEILVTTTSGSAKPSFTLIDGNTLVDDQGTPTASAGITIDGTDVEDTFIGINPTSGMGLVDGASPIDVRDSGTRTRFFAVDSQQIVVKAVDYTPLWNDGTILVDASGAARTIELPYGGLFPRKKFTIKKIDSSVNAVTVLAHYDVVNGQDLIDGVLSKILTAQYEAVTIQCDNGGGPGVSDWYIIG